jgi:hypothetical protein
MIYCMYKYYDGANLGGYDTGTFIPSAQHFFHKLYLHVIFQGYMLNSRPV